MQVSSNYHKDPLTKILGTDDISNIQTYMRVPYEMVYFIFIYTYIYIFFFSHICMHMYVYIYVKYNDLYTISSKNKRNILLSILSRKF